MTYNRLFPLLGLLAATLSLLFAACQGRPDSTAQWRSANEKAFAAYADSSDFVRAEVDGSNAFIYMKKRAKGDGTEYPIETSRVLLHYEVYFAAGSKSFIEGNFDSEAPQFFTLSRGLPTDMITGMRIGVQNMYQGDEAEMIIPWHLGYGAAKRDGLEAYTTLRYVVRLDSIIPETAL